MVFQYPLRLYCITLISFYFTLAESAADLKIAIDLKNSLEMTMKKYRRLVFEEPKSSRDGECSSENEEMEDVVSKGPTADEELIARLQNECDQVLD